LAYRTTFFNHSRNAQPDARRPVRGRGAPLSDWFDEFRGYQRKDGLIVKSDGDLMSATRIAVMARRHGRDLPFGSKVIDRRVEFQRVNSAEAISEVRL
jgi:hypothetical protein